MSVGWLIDSLMGVGYSTGVRLNYTCPPGTVVTGFSGGADGPKWIDPAPTYGSLLQGFQLACSCELAGARKG